MEFTLTNALIALGQLLIGALFVYGGLTHFGPASEKIIPLIEARGIPMPRQALYVASVFQLVCGACLMLGVLIVPAALGLVLFTIVASVAMANFWDQPPGEAREMMQNVWASNVAIVGGLLLAAAGAL